MTRHQRIVGPLSAFGAAVALATLLVDQGFKWWMLALYDIDEKGRVAVTPFFDLVMVWNRGISYGLFQQDGEAGRWFLIVVTLGAVALLALWLATARNRVSAAALGLVIGGALGNLVDRLVHGAVADFFHFHAFGYSWYVFNIADAAIVAGIAVLLYESLSGRRAGPTGRGG